LINRWAASSTTFWIIKITGPLLRLTRTHR
jgi:hypothetical protein